METAINVLDVQSICLTKRAYFETGATKSYDFRIQKLKDLKAAIVTHEEALFNALYKDLRKSRFEAYTSEIAIIYEEIKFAIKHLEGWMESEPVGTPLVLQPAMSRLYYEPKGVVLLISPFNYPFMLLFGPLVGAIAAGNTIVLKPSEVSSHTEAVILKITESAFKHEYIETILGPGDVVVPQLIKGFDFDHILFTGSTRVGKEIMKLAAEHLSPVSLELGGKSPAIVHHSAKIKQTAKKIIWGKTYNAGQTCVAPDYVLVHESKKDRLIAEMIKQIEKMFGKNAQQSPDFGRLIHKNRFKAVTAYLKEGKIAYGGRVDEADLYVEPTILTDVSFEDSVMREEIFGPVLPIITYSDESEILPILRKNPNPLSCYIFTTEADFESYIIDNFAFGGGCVNNTLSHLGNPSLPFGGRGASGIGSYHGKFGFDVFSHVKGILKSPSTLDPGLLYPPYKNRLFKLIKWYIK